MNAITINTYGGVYCPPGSEFEIVFGLEDGKVNCPILEATGTSSFVLSLLEGASGSGKTTFLNELYKYLYSNGNATCDIRFGASPTIGGSTPVAVGYIPQNVQMVNHWRVSSLLRKDSRFLEGFFPGQEIEAITKKHLSELSGGQRKKIYSCSMLDKLLEDRAVNSAFALLDETFDGLGAQEAKRSILMIKDIWAGERPHSALHLILVTHLNEQELRDIGLPKSNITLSTISSGSTELLVEIRSQI